MHRTDMTAHHVGRKQEFDLGIPEFRGHLT